MRAIDRSHREFLFLPLLVQNGQVFAILQESKVALHLNAILATECKILSRNAESAKKSKICLHQKNVKLYSFNNL